MCVGVVRREHMDDFGLVAALVNAGSIFHSQYASMCAGALGVALAQSSISQF